MKVPIIHGAVRNSLVRALTCCLLATALLFSFGVKTAQAQVPAVVDPGPRPGPQPPTGAGHPIPGLPADQVTFWVDV